MHGEKNNVAVTHLLFPSRSELQKSGGGKAEAEAGLDWIGLGMRVLKDDANQRRV